MDPVVKITANWLTRKPDPNAIYLTYFLALLLTAAGFFSDVLSATPIEVFGHHQYWRAWSALLAHADLGHLLSNSMILLPLAHYLAGHFGYGLFPFSGLVLGGLTNLIVLNTMPENTALLGISGVVYWMGAVWLTLFVVIDRRETFRRRLAIAIFLAAMLFAPETFRPEVSYLSHFVGFVLGMISATTYYLLFRKTIEAAEVKELIFEDALTEDQQRVLQAQR